MCQLLETIKLEDGRLFNLDYHNRRLNASRRELFGTVEAIDLTEIIQVPDNCTDGLYRCRIVYAQTIETIEFVPQKERTYSSLKLVNCDNIDYHLKYADRTLLNELYARRGKADEIAIVKNGEMTDCSIGNLLFYDGQSWVTPANPLLKGTQRQKLLESGRIQEEIIFVQDLNTFQKAGIINAFFDLKNMPIISIENIF